MTFDESKVRRDHAGRFAENWAARLADQLARGSSRRRDFRPDTSAPSSAAPRARSLGHVRVGEHPDRMGLPGGAESYFGTSTHPDAGGVWVDPSRPGTQVAPRFLNDFGSPMRQLVKPPSRSEQRKRDVSARRRDPRESSIDGGKVGRRLAGAPEAAVKEVRRAQRRARVEGSARTPKRRTPGGTQVDGWMSKVNDRIGQKGTGRG